MSGPGRRPRSCRGALTPNPRFQRAMTLVGELRRRGRRTRRRKSPSGTSLTCTLGRPLVTPTMHPVAWSLAHTSARALVHELVHWIRPFRAAVVLHVANLSLQLRKPPARQLFTLGFSTSVAFPGTKTGNHNNCTKKVGRNDSFQFRISRAQHDVSPVQLLSTKR